MSVHGAFVEIDDDSNHIPDGPIATPESIFALVWASSIVWGPLLLMYSQNSERYNTLLQQLPRALAIGLGFSHH